MKEKDASAFVDDAQQQAQQNMARFTAPAGKSGSAGTLTKADWKGMSLDERIALKNSNPELYNSMKG